MDLPYLFAMAAGGVAGGAYGYSAGFFDIKSHFNAVEKQLTRKPSYLNQDGITRFATLNAVVKGTLGVLGGLIVAETADPNAAVSEFTENGIITLLSSFGAASTSRFLKDHITALRYGDCAGYEDVKERPMGQIYVSDIWPQTVLDGSAVMGLAAAAYHFTPGS